MPAPDIKDISLQPGLTLPIAGVVNQTFNHTLCDIYWGGKNYVTFSSKVGQKPVWKKVVPLAQVRVMELFVEQPE